jgi:hypothetical protein
LDALRFFGIFLALPMVVTIGVSNPRLLDKLI